MTADAEALVDAMNKIHGVHAGYRAVHAKGACCRGRFIAAPTAPRICRAAHFSGEAIGVTVRFSNGSGRPTRADGAKDERGMAVKFHLPDGSTTDIVSLTLPVFFVRTPEDFLEFLRIQEPDADTGKPDLARVAEFVAGHPEAQRAVGFSLLSPAPASFATCNFHGIHSFRMTGSDGQERYARYRWIPDAGEATMTEAETRALGGDYLFEDLRTRLSTTGIGFRLEFQLAGPEDDVNDATVPWPEERETVAAGHMDLTEWAAHECDAMIFDPTRVTDGIACSDDPLLPMRSAAYSVSYVRRTSAPTA